MLRFAENRVAVWKIENKENYSLVQMSSSRYDKKLPDGKQNVNSSWAFVRFIGNAHTKISEMKVPEKGPIQLVITASQLTNEPYLKEGVKTYPKMSQIAVFDFREYVKGEKINQPIVQQSMDSAPAVAAEDEGDLPY
jgi:hypothetical protein